MAPGKTGKESRQAPAKEDKCGRPTTGMVKLGAVELEIIQLGIAKKGRFDENDIEKSSLKRLGVGRTLDLLASLKDRKLVSLNGDGSFSVTDLARHILWDEKVPAGARILRLLEIRPGGADGISEVLGMQPETVFEEVEKLRRDRLVLMSPLRQEGKLVRVYEILPEGIEAARRIEAEGVRGAGPAEGAAATNPKSELMELVDEIIADVEESGHAGSGHAVRKLNRLREKLGGG